MNKFALLRPSSAKVQQEPLPERKPERKPERVLPTVNDERAARMDIVENIRNETPVIMLDDQNTHVIDRNSILARIPYGKEFRFHGRVLANCIRGRISVMGYTMIPSDDFMLPCYAPTCLPPVSFTSEASGDEETVSELINYFSEAAKAFVLNCSNESVLLLARLNDGLEQLDSINIGVKIFGGLQGFAFEGFFPNTPFDAGVFSFGEEWRKAANFICQADTLQRVVVYGLKNSGKSTFCKYLVNRMLASGIKRIAYLDSDAGQCEFSPPGYLSIVLVESPLVGPNFTHMKKHVIKSCFFGNVAADADPDRYLQNVLELYSFYKNSMMSHDIPLVINTHGWLKGLGYDAFLQFHDTVQPTALFQLTQLNKKNNDVPSIEGEILIPSAVSGKSCLSAKDLRTLSMVSYFALAGEHDKFGYQLYDFTPLNKRIPVFVSFDDITVDIKDAEDLDPLDNLLVLNASLVSLEKSDGDHLGLALIRAIISAEDADKTKGGYFIVSPYSAEELHQNSVNALVRRNINLPPELFFQDRESSGPYGDLYHAESMSAVTSEQEEVKDLSSLYLTNESVNENSNYDDDLFSEDGQHVKTVELSESINELSRVIDWEELKSAVTSQERSDHKETKQLEGAHLPNLTGELPTSSMFIKSSPLHSQMDRREQRSTSKNGTPVANESWRERELMEEIYKLKRELDIERQHSYELERHLRQAEASERHFEEQHNELLEKIQSFYLLGDKVEELAKENAELNALNASLEDELDEIRINVNTNEKQDTLLRESNQELMRQVEVLQREKQNLNIELERSFTELASFKDTVNAKESIIRDYERRENKEVVWLRDQMELHKKQIDYLQQCLERMNRNALYEIPVERSCPNSPQIETAESIVESSTDSEDLSGKINNLEESLSNLCVKKDNLEAEYRKLPIAINTFATRRRKGEIEDLLDEVEAQINSIRLQLRYLRAH